MKDRPKIVASPRVVLKKFRLTSDKRQPSRRKLLLVLLNLPFIETYFGVIPFGCVVKSHSDIRECFGLSQM